APASAPAVPAPVVAVVPPPVEPAYPIVQIRDEIHRLPEDEPLPNDRRRPLPSALQGARVFSSRLSALVAIVGVLGLGGGILGVVLGQTHDLLGLLVLLAVVGVGQALALETDDGAISVSAVGALTGA